MKTRDIIERLQHALGFSSLAALARELEINPSAINAAIRQKRLPDVWIYKVAYRTGRRVEWLRSGEGKEFTDVAAEEKAKYRRAYPPALQDLIEQWAELSDAEQSIVDNAMKLLLSSDAETRALTVRVVEFVREQHKFRASSGVPRLRKKTAGSA